MADLDIQIDVPDDDGLESPVRVLNGGWIPGWLKAAVALAIGALAALGVGAYLVGRSNAAIGVEETTDDEPASATTELGSAPDSPTVASSLEAVQGWETFVRTGDLTAVAPSFDPNGPQWELFVDAAERSATDQVDFQARNLSESTDGLVTTVSMDLVVTDGVSDTVYPYDFVYLDGGSRVWTVVDRRSPGQAALPPAGGMIDAARQSWRLFVDAMALGDGEGVVEVVSPDTVALAEQITTTIDGGSIPDDDRLIGDEELFELLVARVEAGPTDDLGEVIIALLDLDQRQALLAGELASWTQTDPDRIIASLEVGGEPITLVPFVAAAEGWRFDLVGALNQSGGSA